MATSCLQSLALEDMGMPLLSISLEVLWLWVSKSEKASVAAAFDGLALRGLRGRSPCASGADCRPFSTGRRRTALLAALCAVYSLLQSACRQSKPTLWDFCFGSHFILYVLISRALE